MFVSDGLIGYSYSDPAILLFIMSIILFLLSIYELYYLFKETIGSHFDIVLLS